MCQAGVSRRAVPRREEAFFRALLCFEDEVAAFEEIDEADALLASFVRHGHGFLEDIGIAIGIGGCGVRRLDVEDVTEIAEKRLCIRPLGGRGVTPLNEKFGGSHVGVECSGVPSFRAENGACR